MKNNQKSVLLVVEWADPRFYHGVVKYAKQAGWHLNLDYIYSRQLPANWNGDGCISMVASSKAFDYLKTLNMPVVRITDEKNAVLPRVGGDDTAVGAEAADYFIKLGFHNFACYSTDPTPISAARHDGFVNRLEGLGYSASSLFRNATGPDAGAKWEKRKLWLIKELKRLPKPAAVFCIDDRMSLNIVEACMECGIEIPTDLAVLGVGNLELACECSAVPLSSFRIDFEEFGYQSSALLDRIMNGESSPSSPLVIPAAGIEERRSTYTLAIEDPAGRKAFRFMLDHYQEPIGVADIADAGGLTRWHLAHVTRNELNTTPAKLLEDTRIKRAFTLLKTTNYTVHRVAYESGLGSALRLQRILRKRFNTSPSAWRKKQLTDRP